ncbi:MAG: hypothetical protein DRO89_01760 [Candidatus Altiarchaeales archaeon]|nr:MAG: hypothetical protein DRO89_01760 [Candidatus Altiarchaeales archaeon]
MKIINLQYSYGPKLEYRFFANYLRIGRGISVLFIPILAFTISRSTEVMDLITVSGITLLGIAGTYSYNCLKDAKEDRENSSHPNPLKTSIPNTLEKKIPYCLFIFAILIALLFVNRYSLLLFLALALFSVIYSKFKIKRIFLVKTMTVSFCYMTLFFACFLAFSPIITSHALLSGLLILMLLFSYSVISDIRDVEVDKKYNFITIPVKYGYLKSELLVVSIFVLLNIALMFFYAQDLISLEVAGTFFMFIPVELYLVYHLHIRDLRGVDTAREISFILTGIFLLILNLPLMSSII